MFTEPTAVKASWRAYTLGDFVQGVIRRAKTLEFPKCDFALLVPLLAPSPFP